MIPRFSGHLTITTPDDVFTAVAFFATLLLVFTLILVGKKILEVLPAPKGYAPDFIDLSDGTRKVIFRPMVGPRGGFAGPRAQIMTKSEYERRWGQYPPHPKPEPRWMQKF